MSGVPGTVGRPEWSWPRAPGRPKSQRKARPAFAVPELALRAIPFFCLAFLAAAHWTALVQPNQTRRALVVTLIVTGGGVLIALTRRIPRLPGLLLRIVLVVLMALLAATAIGIRFKLLMPAHWGTLGDRVSGGLSVVGTVGEWPYKGPNAWLRLTTLLAVPLVLVVASALVFWPRVKEARGAYRASALILLVALYGVAVAARPFDHQALRGIGLLFCLAAWMWLPRLSGRDAAAATTAIAVAAIAALILTPKLAASEPWVDYRNWSWTLQHEKTVSFDWQHSYGPLHWPRKGTTMLLIKSKEPHYWKAETLDRFDGVRWETAPLGDVSVANGEVSSNPKWLESVHVTVRGLRSDLVIGPGSLLRVDGAPGDPITASYGIALATGSLKAGDSYTALGYTPDPTSKQMRAAKSADPFFIRYTTISLPQPGGFVSTLLHLPLRGRPDTGDPYATQTLASSHYARVYALAKKIAGTATTDYDIVRRIGAYLENNYGYSERVSRHAYPLESFLFVDKKGYCQHFSGAAALMLRMLGIPARVASGFAPGSYDSDTKEYVVRDLDAHSWIEVWFQGIGWVPFDPTPAAAPASSQSSSFTPLSEIASAARGDAKDKLTPKLRAELLGETQPGGGPGAGSAAANGTPWGWIIAGSVVGLLVLVSLVISLVRMRSRRRPPPTPCGDAEVDHLVRLLTRLGLEIKTGTTLLELEQRVERLGGPDAARYAKRLRARRFGGNGEAAPSRAERRALRQTLAKAVGAGPLSRLHLAMPDNLLH
jgi:hypothetical protein